jgi:primase-polymerase (primpol)-like protein
MMMTSLSFEDATIPAELKALPHWVNWRAERNGERIEKIPMCAVTGKHASTTDPGTWRITSPLP